MNRDTPTWTTRESRPEDAEGLQALFKEVFGYDRGEQHNAWKFDHNPAGPPIVAVAEDGDLIVGQYALWPMRLRLGTEVVLGAQSLDTMTHPRYRGQGMFTRLAKEAMQSALDRDVEVLIGFPNAQSYPGFIRKLDWDHTGDVPVYIRPLHLSRHGRLPSWAGPTVDLATRLLPTGARRDFEIRSTKPSTSEMETLLQTPAGSPTSCQVERSQKYVDWRFEDASGMKYTWISAYRGGSLQAVAVWGTDLHHGNAVFSALIGADVESKGAALAEAIRQAHDAGCPAISAVGQGDDLPRLMRRAGFIRRGGLPLIVRKLTPRVLGANVHNHSTWNVFGADLDTM